MSAGALLRAALRPPGRSAADELTQFLRARFDAPEAVLFDSGTHALTAAIRAAQRAMGRDAPVALPAFTCYDVATAAVGADAPIILYDIDPDTLGPDWTSFEAALQAGAAIAVVAPLYGYPVDWDMVQEKARAYGTLLIEDAAQAAGAEWNSRPVGSLGPLTVLSFGRGKGWTGAGGGAVLNRAGLAIDAPAPGGAMYGVRTAVLAAAQMLLSHPSAYGIPASMPWLHLGETRYREPSTSYAIGGVSASLVHATAAAALQETAFRQRQAPLLADSLLEVRDIRLIRLLPGATPGYLRFPLRVTAPELRTRMLDSLRRHGAAPSYPASLSALEPVRLRLVNEEARFPGAGTLVRELVSLPTHTRSRLSSAQLMKGVASVHHMGH